MMSLHKLVDAKRTLVATHCRGGRRRGPPPQGTLADGCSGSETHTPKKARR